MKSLIAINTKQENGGHFNNRDELTELYIETGADQKMSFINDTKFYWQVFLKSFLVHGNNLYMRSF